MNTNTINRRVTLLDIAKNAGVHVSTVSLALRNHPKIATKTRKRIAEIAKKLDYKPDPQLLSLSSYRNAMKPKNLNASIAVISDFHISRDLTPNHYYRRIEKGIENEAKANGYNPTFLTLGKDFRNSRELERILKSRGILGILFNSIYHPDTHFDLDWDQYACVKINCFPKDIPIDSVSGNGLLAVSLAFNFALHAEFKRPALVVCADDEAHIDHRYESSFLIMQKQLPVRDRIQPYVFEYCDVTTLAPELMDWIEHVQPDVILSNWDLNFCCKPKNPNQGNTHPQFLHLEADPHSPDCIGVNPDNEGIGKRAVEMLIHKLNRFEYGFPQNTANMLVNPFWHQPSALNVCCPHRLHAKEPRFSFSFQEAELQRIPNEAVETCMP